MPIDRSHVRPWLIRTDFSDEVKWTTIRQEIDRARDENGETFGRCLNFIENEKLSTTSILGVVNSLPESYPSRFVFVADQVTFEHQEAVVLLADFCPDYERFDVPPSQRNSDEIHTFRVLPSCVNYITCFLGVHLDFQDFMFSLDDDDVFRAKTVQE
ncbi:DUF6924 domain-containing protein [Novipirellula rosea]|uniref:DUF6924 domain-containing protein n=1 Tax=Novipirellula rosea TaxID=1031540 RepID=A0ABP8NHH5_9BACT